MKTRKMKWPLISIRSSQQQTTRKSKKSPLIPGGETPPTFESSSCNDECSIKMFPIPILLLRILAIGLTIATTFGCSFGSISRGFGSFNVKNNIFSSEINNECELEKSGLINGYDNGPLLPQTRTQTAHPSAPPNDTVFNLNLIGAGLREFNVYGYVFDVVLNENEFYYGVNDMFDYFNENVYDNDIFYLFVYFLMVFVVVMQDQNDIMKMQRTWLVIGKTTNVYKWCICSHWPEVRNVVWYLFFVLFFIS